MQMESNKLNELFEVALGLEEPWVVVARELDLENNIFYLKVDFRRGAKFSYESETEELSEVFPVHDTVEKRWRHLNFFQFECQLICRIPRVKLDNGKVRQIKAPWEGLSNGFTLYMEAFLLQLCLEMTILGVSKITGIEDKRIWRMLEKYVGKARDDIDMSNLKKIGIDETSMKKRHNYVTLFVDLDSRKTVFVAEGKDSKTVDAFKEDLEKHNGKSEAITDVSIDMSRPFIKGVKNNFPAAEITFDKFHIMKILSKAVNAIRKQEALENDLLKGTKTIFDKNRENLTAKQASVLKELELQKIKLKTVRGFHLRETFQEIYNSADKESFVDRLRSWYSWARKSQLAPMQAAALTLKRHWEGIVRWYDSRLNNGLLEGLNSLVQAAKNKARGFRNFNYFRTSIFLTTGNLNFSKYNRFHKKL